MCGQGRNNFTFTVIRSTVGTGVIAGRGRNMPGLGKKRAYTSDNSRSKKTHPCVAANGKPVRFDVCRTVTRVLEKNLRLCTECLCPWRMCRICISQGVMSEDAQVMDVTSGMCSFHLLHGIDYKRGDDGETPVHSPSPDKQRPVWKRPELPIVTDDTPSAAGVYRPSTSSTNISFEDYLSKVER